MTKLAFGGDNILTPEEIVKQADKCLRLLIEVPMSKLTTWEQNFFHTQELLNMKREACSYRELLKLREIVGKYAQ